MAEETQYTANGAIGLLSTANSNLDGSGTLVSLVTGASNGTLIKNIYIKLRVTSSQGMIRFFITDNSGTTQLLTEIPVIPRTQASINKTFETTIPLNFCLQSGYVLKASTEVANSTVVFVEALDWAYYGAAVRQDTTLYTANNYLGQISTANNSLTAGVLGQVYAAGAAASGFLGSSISSLTFKSSVNVTPGMVRLWIKNTGAVKYILKEYEVNTVTKSNTDDTYETTVVFDNDLDIPADWSLWASTENAENFNVFVEGNDWKYEA